MNSEVSHWRTCSSCKKPIAFSVRYFECSVSTCIGGRTGYVFCSVSCWERHLPGARHRDAAAIEKISPTFSAWKNQEQEGPRRIIVQTPSTNLNNAASNSANNPAKKSSNPLATSMDQEILVVVSKMKTYIKERADMNTANEVSEVLSNLIRQACNDAIDKARSDGRKTVMPKDFT